MTLADKISRISATLFDKVINYKIVRLCVISVISTYIPLLIIGVIIAGNLDPDGYSIVSNWISDLGTRAHTPAPYLYDIACMVAGSLTIPFSFYMENLLAPLPSRNERPEKFPRLRFRLASYSLLFSLIGNIGYIGVGIFSGDRNYFDLHMITSSLAFGGFTLGAFFMGWLIIIYETKIPKVIGIYGLVGPFTTIVIFLIISNPLWEWILLFSILAWIIPLSITVFHKKEKEI